MRPPSVAEARARGPQPPISPVASPASAPRPRGPDFIGIGVQKCGTSWIADVLRQHPSVFFPRKEINFFVRHFHRGYDWYEAWFAEKQERLAGEITPNYILSPRPDAARKQFYPRWWPREQLTFWRRRPSARDEISARYPDAKVFAVFRNPVERAWSHYWMWRNRKERIGKGSRVVSFRRMFLDDGRWIRTTGLYADHLTRWRERFPGLGVFLFDDLKQRPTAFAQQIYRFIGVDDSFTPDLGRGFNRGRYMPMPREDHALALEAYRDQVRRFAELVGCDLGHWLDAPAPSLAGARREPSGPAHGGAPQAAADPKSTSS